MIDASSLADCGACGGDVPGIAHAIEMTCKYLVNGHVGLRELYKQLAVQTASETDRQTFYAEAEKHDRLAKETAELKLPEVGEDGDHTRADSKPGGG